MTDAAPPTRARPGAPAAGWASGPLGAVQAAGREIARQTALRARAVAEFAASRPASADRQPGEPGAMGADRRAVRPDVLAGVSEWAVQELALAQEISSQAAEALLTRSLTLVHRLPRTLDALEAGALHEGHLWPMLSTVAPIADAKLRAAVESEVLAWAAGRITTPAQLGDKARRVVLRRDARDAAGRLERALRGRGVSVRPDSEDGMAVLSALLTVPEAQALLDALGRYADALAADPDDTRTRGQRMADCLLDLVLRPGEKDHAPVQAQLTVVAGVRALLGSDEPGEIGGQVVPAELVRALARALGLFPGDAAAEVGPPAPGPADPAPAPQRRYPTEEEELADWWAATEALVLREWGGEPDPPPEVVERHRAEQARFDRMPTPVEMGVFDAPPDGTSWPGGAFWHEKFWEEESGHDASWQDESPPDGCPYDESPRDGSPFDGSRLDGSSLGSRPNGVPPAGAGPAVHDGPGPAPGTWAAADRALDGAGTALLDLQRAVGRAERAVTDAQRADAADEQAWERSPAGRVTAADDTLAALAAATAAQRTALADLLQATGGGGLVDRPRIAVVDELTGALLALTDARELRRLGTCGATGCRRHPGSCTHDLTGRPGLGPPPPTRGYRPGAVLDRRVRARDRRCRFPGCRRPVPRGGELDHDRPYPDGETSAANLVGYCTPHHRGKHQAPGWRNELAPDGALTVTTPSRMVATTTPPPY
ncbi:DUF222 domain-containing protein [Blastococcus xanthinilyticus]|uniref:Uncharacterized protein DUF222 n=1 Tax=Blastococcus xanthinilyticus TaxID=1564164 RepID=A0A5S5CQI0_9ACTN|nr:DUF222 domain-containing protein [Blastococcus xanthinilyticus]TYP86121.1 uncharacterized protein DUF222 [Blastococcus xanthinilyticus]